MTVRLILSFFLLWEIFLCSPFDSWAVLDQSCIDAENHINLKKKIKLYTQCIRSGKLSDNEYSIYYTYLGITYEHLGDNILAIKNYDQAILMNSKFYDAYIKRGIIYYKLGDFKHSIQDFENAIDLRPNNRKAYNNLAWVLVTSEDPSYRDGPKALMLVQTALHLYNFDDFRIMDTLAAVYAELGQFDKATDAQSKSIKIAEKRGEAELLDELREALSNYEMNRKYYKENLRNSLIIE